MKDALGHGSSGRGGRLAKPIPGHFYHGLPNESLRYIIKDAHEAGRNAQGLGDEKGVNKYADQVNDASTVLNYRRQGGKQDEPNHGLLEGMKAKLSSDLEAGRMLHSGTSKSDAAPVHDAFGKGR